jgi:integrase
MPKAVSLKVRKDPARSSPWYINVPASLSETGRRQRLFFASRDAAAGMCERLKTRRDNFGVSLGNLTSAQIVEAADCFGELVDHPGVSLSEAVRGYLEILSTRKASIPFGELFRQFLKAKAAKSVPYLDHLKWTQQHFSPLADKLACEVTVRDLETILEPLRPSVRDAFRRYVRAVFNFGVRLDYLALNPAAKLEPGNLIKGETEIFTPEEVEQMLRIALRDDLEFLPYRIFGFFAGIRPAGELVRLNWSTVSLTDRIVTLPAAITKTRRKRHIELSANACAWLEAYARGGGNLEGLVAPFSASLLRKKHRANYRAAGIKTWIPQGARHSFCSYWLKQHGDDVDRLVILSGHQSREILWRHYYRACTKREALAFWSIEPPDHAQTKIVDFAAA